MKHREGALENDSGQLLCTANRDEPLPALPDGKTSRGSSENHAASRWPPGVEMAGGKTSRRGLKMLRPDYAPEYRVS